MKKWIALFMGLLLVFSFTACGNTSPSNASQTESSAEEQETSQTETPTAATSATETSATETTEAEVSESELPSDLETEPETGKTLVVYFSATGNTEGAANYIAAATDADAFELEPKDPYTDADLDWTDDNSRVVYEHDNPDARDIELVAATVPDWESYDTVFIGYPIWWGIAAWPVDSFVKANDFTGKTVVPFCTSSSSGLGESGELLAELTGTGDWLEGKRFSSGVTEDAVQTWIEELGL
ncbi:MAG: flavodoxin [Lachnospiraceae bacterium]|nr:flavodoxin [Lachnospiraceae bacterium]